MIQSRYVVRICTRAVLVIAGWIGPVSRVLILKRDRLTGDWELTIEVGLELTIEVE